MIIRYFAFRLCCVRVMWCLEKCAKRATDTPHRQPEHNIQCKYYKWHECEMSGAENVQWYGISSVYFYRNHFIYQSAILLMADGCRTVTTVVLWLFTRIYYKDRGRQSMLSWISAQRCAHTWSARHDKQSRRQVRGKSERFSLELYKCKRHRKHSSVCGRSSTISINIEKQNFL